MDFRYLDHNATTPLHPEVAEAMAAVLRDSGPGGSAFGNPSSLHHAGREARRRVEDARESVARLVGASAHEVIFTSGGTEANNALRGILGSPPGGGASAPTLRGPLRGRHLVTTSFEHSSVLETFQALAAEGWEVTYADPDGEGVVSPETLMPLLRSDTALISVMAANNEVGSVQPVAAIGALARERGSLFHCDAVQALGKVEGLSARVADYMSFSAHKINGPKGVGAFYARKGAPMQGFIRGGPQERQARGGTENVAGIAGFGKAAELWLREGAAERVRLAGLRAALEAALRERIPDVVVNSAGAERLPNTLNVTLPGCRADLMVIGLDMRGVEISAGSACASGSVKYSHVILALGKGQEAAACSLRFSLGLGSSLADMAFAAQATAETAASVRGL